jgi:predicted TIM-barrel fold metal-dependent hydrolase
MEEKRLSELTQHDLNKTVGIDIGWQQIEKGKLTDFYGSLDEDENAIVAVQIDDNLTFFLAPNSTIFID